MTTTESSARPAERGAALLGAAGIGAGGATLATFGVADLFGDTDYGGRLRAGLMLAVGLYVLTGAAALAWVVLARRSRGSVALGGVVLTAAVLTTASGAFLMSYQVVAGDYTIWLWCWIAMIVTGASVGVLVARRGARVPFPRQFAVAVTVTTLLAGANFAYTTLYQPAVEPIQLTVDVGIGQPTRTADGSFASLPLTISFTNSGRAAVTVVMSTYSLVGRTSRPAAAGRAQGELNLDVQEGRPASRWTVAGRDDVLQSDTFVFPGTTFNPGDRSVAERTADISLPTAYDDLAVNAWVLVLRSDDVRLRTDISRAEHSWDSRTGEHLVDAPAWAAAPGVDWSRHQIPIEETSFLRSQIRQRWTGYVWRVASDPAPGRPPGSYLSFHFTPSGRIDADKATADDENQVAGERYGLTRIQTGVIEKSAVELGLR